MKPVVPQELPDIFLRVQAKQAELAQEQLDITRSQNDLFKQLLVPMLTDADYKFDQDKSGNITNIQKDPNADPLAARAG